MNLRLFKTFKTSADTLLLQRESPHVGDHGQDRHPVEDLLPCPDAVGLGRHGPPELGGELPGVYADLQDVVAEGQQRSQGEGGHEQGDETKLNHCRKAGERRGEKRREQR